MALTPSTMPELGMIAPDFTLSRASGSPVSLDEVATGPDGVARPFLVQFICNHCPFVVHLADALADFGREYQANGLGIVAINSNDPVGYPADSPERMVEEARARGYTFPYLFDADQSRAKAYGAACTPDFFLFDANRLLVYRGQFDASRPNNGKPVTGSDLRRAADAVLAGEPAVSHQTPSVGCNIKWMAGNAPEYFG